MTNEEHPTPAPDDWRRQGQERDLRGVRLFARTYRPYRPGWDHDHCSFCREKLSLDPGDLHEGFCTHDEYHWVCPPCYRDFRGEFGWDSAAALDAPEPGD